MRLIHFADTQLGFSTTLMYREDELRTGRLIRETDIEQAMERMTGTILTSPPESTPW